MTEYIQREAVLKCLAYTHDMGTGSRERYLADPPCGAGKG